MVAQNVVSYTTMIDVDNPDLALKPGMTATVRIETARDDDTLRVPAAAVRFRPTADVRQAMGGAPGRRRTGSSLASRAEREARRRSGDLDARRRTPVDACPSKSASPTACWWR